jgi:hypothetical protein
MGSFLYPNFRLYYRTEMWFFKAAISFASISVIISDRGSVISNTSDMIWNAGRDLYDQHMKTNYFIEKKL